MKKHPGRSARANGKAAAISLHTTALAPATRPRKIKSTSNAKPRDALFGAANPLTVKQALPVQAQALAEYAVVMLDLKYCTVSRYDAARQVFHVSATTDPSIRPGREFTLNGLLNLPTRRARAAFIHLPVHFQGALVGMLSLCKATTQWSTRSAAEEHVMLLLAAHTASILHAMQMEERTEAQRRELERLRRVELAIQCLNARIAKTLEPRALGQEVLALLHWLVPFDGCASKFWVGAAGAAEVRCIPSPSSEKSRQQLHQVCSRTQFATNRIDSRPHTEIPTCEGRFRDTFRWSPPIMPDTRAPRAPKQHNSL
ncbi:MAG: GAF domain-containing protein [Chloroflexi bacterium]|nr:GAF domain-containing protein [Chloroflexota bacterium]